MGTFRVELEGTGGHGCQRDYEAGTPIFGCRRQDCPDCVTQEYVEKMMKLFSAVKAKLIHWPDTPTQIVDTFVAPKVEVKTYEVSEYRGNELVKTGEVRPYVDIFPIHRLRDKKF